MKLTVISIHASRGGSDQGAASSLSILCGISIHASRGGSDHLLRLLSIVPGNFNPRFPRGKRRRTASPKCGGKGFQSTLPAGEATAKLREHTDRLAISIHASRGGSDGLAEVFTEMRRAISIHASRGGSDQHRRHYRLRFGISIHASRGGSDVGHDGGNARIHNFNPRFPRGKRLRGKAIP